MTTPYDPSAPVPPATGWPPTLPAPVGTDLSLDADIQGNVLAAFNKDHQVFLMINFGADLASARAYLADVRSSLATNVAVATFNSLFSSARASGHGDPVDLAATWVNLSLTAAAINLLAPGVLAALPSDHAPSIDAWIAPVDAAVLGDAGVSASDGWLFGTPKKPVVHGVLCVASDTEEGLQVELNRQRDRLAEHGASIAFEQRCDVLAGAAHGHEHFGFKDGISQPGILGFDTPSDLPGKTDEVAGSPGTDLVAPGEFVLGFPDQAGNPSPRVPEWMFRGSFLVVRRLAQDVAGFWEQATTQFAALPADAKAGPSGVPSVEALASKLVGRWRDGAPLDTFPTSDPGQAFDPVSINEFSFDGDADGSRVPMFAHIRKVYPRSTVGFAGGEDEANKHRILRRGIPFGQIYAPAEGSGKGDDAERGLWFQCYQSKLEEQFIFLQQTWINAPNFPIASTGPDAVIGEAGSCPLHTGSASSPSTLTIGQFVKTEGTLYAFTPALSTIDKLAAGAPLI